MYNVFCCVVTAEHKVCESLISYMLVRYRYKGGQALQSTE